MIKKLSKKLLLLQKNILFFFIFICFLTMHVSAQPGAHKGERVHALKIGFITHRLDLTPDEAQKFWPVFNTYENEIRQLILANKGGDELENEEKVLNLRKRFRIEFTRILGAAKASKLFIAERDFRSALLRKLKNPQNQPQDSRKESL